MLHVLHNTLFQHLGHIERLQNILGSLTVALHRNQHLCKLHFSRKGRNEGDFSITLSGLYVFPADLLLCPQSWRIISQISTPQKLNSQCQQCFFKLPRPCAQQSQVHVPAERIVLGPAVLSTAPAALATFLQVSTCSPP